MKLMLGNGRRALRWLAFMLLAVLGGALVWARWPRSTPVVQASLIASATLAGDSAGYARAEGPRPLVFPADDGPHDDFQTEWWYYTGNLSAADGEHFGYQLTFFRRALQPPTGRRARSSDLAAEQVYLAHFALTDVSRGTHDAFERLQRGAGGLAGAQAAPYHVWLEDWSATEDAGGRVQLRARATRASGEEISLALTLQDLKGPVLQGDRGYSRKGAQPGNASYYYSLTRIGSQGTVSVGGRASAVTGLSWMDHEFGTSSLEPGLVGWDWFSLQLDDGSELMLYGLRQAGGGRGAYSSGTLIAPDGSTRRLSPDDFTYRATGQWRSPHSGALYPAGWTIEVPSAHLSLQVTPYLPDQEMDVSFVYWEGAVQTEGTFGGRRVAGSGYVELTGYGGGSLGGRF